MCVIQRVGLNPTSWFLLVHNYSKVIVDAFKEVLCVYNKNSSCVFVVADTAQMGLVETRLAIIPGGGNFHFRFAGLK